MRSACSSWIALLLLAAGCSSDDAPGDQPDAAPDAPAVDAASLDAAASDAAPVACEDRFLPAVVDSVVMGSTPPSDDVDDIVTWQDGDDVQLVYGGQGLLMLVAEVVARGSGLTEAPLDIHVTVALGFGGETVHRIGYGNPLVAAEDGTWRRESMFLAFEIDLPKEGEALVVTLDFGCFAIQRTVIAHLPPEA